MQVISWVLYGTWRASPYTAQLVTETLLVDSIHAPKQAVGIEILFLELMLTLYRLDV